MSSARRRKKLAKKYLTYRNSPLHANVTEEDKWESGKGAATSARYDKRWYERERTGQLHGVAGEQAPVKYNRCKHCQYRRHCSPDLFDMHMRLLNAERKARESESESGSCAASEK